jgi:hypothetical protein
MEFYLIEETNKFYKNESMNLRSCYSFLEYLKLSEILINEENKRLSLIIFHPKTIQKLIKICNFKLLIFVKNQITIIKNKIVKKFNLELLIQENKKNKNLESKENEINEEISKNTKDDEIIIQLIENEKIEDLKRCFTLLSKLENGSFQLSQIFKIYITKFGKDFFTEKEKILNQKINQQKINNKNIKQEEKKIIDNTKSINKDSNNKFNIISFLLNEYLKPILKFFEKMNFILINCFENNFIFERSLTEVLIYFYHL